MCEPGRWGWGRVHVQTTIGPSGVSAAWKMDASKEKPGTRKEPQGLLMCIGWATLCVFKLRE